MTLGENGVKRYTIKETSRLSGLPSSTLRYYETIGLIEPIGRDDSSKHRVYSQNDVDLIDAIACLNATGMSIEDMRCYLENRTKGAAGADQEIQLLQSQAKRLETEARLVDLRRRYVLLKVAYWEAVKVGQTDKMVSIGKKAKALAKDLKFPNT